MHETIRTASRTLGRCCRSVESSQVVRRNLHNSALRCATALPITGTGPPPKAPLPSATNYGEHIERKRRQAEMLKEGKALRAAQQQGKQNPLKKRFWKDVHVKEVPEGYQIYLDARPIRTPSKAILTIPKTKPYLAYAIAIEWDMLTSAQQALKNHNIPMTSIASRAQDLKDADANGEKKMRADINAVMMRYLDTDTLLCWAPEQSTQINQSLEIQTETAESLRNMQIQTAKPIISFLNSTIWPGVEIKPVLDANTIMPSKQSEVTRSIISGWIHGLPAYELAALERAALASKSLLLAARLLIEWSEEFRDLQTTSQERFGIEEAAKACSLEVAYQTGMWGEVEDTHDVEKEDMRRQLGSSVLLLSGMR